MHMIYVVDVLLSAGMKNAKKPCANDMHSGVHYALDHTVDWNHVLQNYHHKQNQNPYATIVFHDAKNEKTNEKTA